MPNPVIKASFLSAIAAAALAVSACTKPADDTATTDTAMAGDATADTMDTMPAATDTTAMAAPSPQEFTDKAAASDMFEMESAKLAQQMSKDQAVKDFAAMMITDHGKSTANLKAMVAKAPSVTLAPKLSAEQQANLDALKNSGANFDSTYKQQQVAAHQTAVAMLNGYAANGTDAGLKSFAAETAPVVEGHLKKAQALPS